MRISYNAITLLESGHDVVLDRVGKAKRPYGNGQRFWARYPASFSPAFYLCRQVAGRGGAMSQTRGIATGATHAPRSAAIPLHNHRNRRFSGGCRLEVCWLYSNTAYVPMINEDCSMAARKMELSEGQWCSEVVDSVSQTTPKHRPGKSAPARSS
jgi:hypothetical protein